jgi:hypothetical protein
MESQMSVSIACEIQETADVPLTVNGSVPVFGTYGQAYDWLYRLGYNRGGKIGVVYECDRDIAVRRFGNRLIEARKLIK